MILVNVIGQYGTSGIIISIASGILRFIMKRIWVSQAGDLLPGGKRFCSISFPGGNLQVYAPSWMGQLIEA